MLNAVIRFALQQRLLVIAFSLFLLGYGGWQMLHMEIDVFPNLNRPRVVVMTEAPGLAPEEVEALITFPLETALNGANGVQEVRTSSGVGISVIYVEFDWGTDIYTDRQIVMERLALVQDRLPPGLKPSLAPISSIMGQIVMIGMWSHENDKTKIFELDPALLKTEAEATADRPIDRRPVSAEIRAAFDNQRIDLSNRAELVDSEPGQRWLVEDPDADEDGDRLFALRLKGKTLEVHRLTDPLELRTIADWVVRQRLLTIPGVSQVFTMGGGRKQFQVLVNPDSLLRYGVTLADVKTAVQESNLNATGGYLDQQGPNELLVRGLGRLQSIEDLQKVVITIRDGRPLALSQVAHVVEAAQVKRGDSTAFAREADGTFSGGPAVVLTINKQPEADTRAVTQRMREALEDLQPSLPKDIRINPDIYSQEAFIDRAVENVVEALRDGGILVVIILFLFLMNLRTTFITLTAIPMSIVMTALIFKAFGLSINTMTLGGLAVAIGELVDDAIVDVENIYRRLRENRHSPTPKHPLLVVFQASAEIRNSIVFSTMIVVLVFVPLFALSGMEGRLFTPLGVAYIVSILASLLVSLTLTPVLSYLLLANSKVMDHGEDGFLLRFLKAGAERVIRLSLAVPSPILGITAAAVAISGFIVMNLESDFLPPFNEGSVQLNVVLPPGTSLKTSNEIAGSVDRRLEAIADIESFARRTGRAELDEHAEGVNTSEYIITLDPKSPRSREQILDEIRESMAGIPGIVTAVEQPLAHLISHMLSGVKAQIGIKLYGDDLDVLRSTAQKMKTQIADVPGLKDLMVEPQIIIPQLRIEVDRDRLLQYGLRPQQVNEYIETALNGEIVSQVLIGQRTFDLTVRLDEPFRENLEVLQRLSIELPGGGKTPLSSVARVYESGGPNTINREQVRRRIVLQANVGGRGLVDVVQEIQTRLKPLQESLPPGYFLEYGGQFQSQQSASRVIAVLFVISLLGIFMVLYTMFHSVNLSLQVMSALPMAFIGAVAALVLTGQTLTIASMVGFISLGGIASRNGILLISHYLHLVRHEGEGWTWDMIVRAGQERLAPVLMTALTAGIGLVPLVLAAGEPGKEILYPVATVILGGVISSTALDFFVHPALFWLFGRREGERLVKEHRSEIELVEETDASAAPAHA